MFLLEVRREKSLLLLLTEATTETYQESLMAQDKNQLHLMTQSKNRSFIILDFMSNLKVYKSTCSQWQMRQI